MNAKNIFENIPLKAEEEIIEKLLVNKNIRIERIISKGHDTKDDFWYDQDENEWVIVLQGEAKLLFEEREEVLLKTGDYINIPSHIKHRVEWTNPKKDTIWLAVFY